MPKFLRKLFLSGHAPDAGSPATTESGDELVLDQEGDATVRAGASRVQRFSRNMAGHDFVVGDIHGCFATFDAALDDLGFDPGHDRMFSVGDLVDRGPESHRALEYIAQPWFHAVRGNHEQFVLDTSLDDRRAVHVWWANGGGWFFAQSGELQNAFRRVLSTLPYVIEVESETGTIGIVHADVPRGMSWGEFSSQISSGNRDALETAIWGRSRATGTWEHGVDGIQRVFVGHTPVPAVRIVGNVYCIDTGAVFALMDDLVVGGLTFMRLGGSAPHTHSPVVPSRQTQLW